MTGDLNQEYITTHKGPSYCVSIGGLDEAQLTNSRTADQFTIQPVMAIREKVPQKSTTTTVTDSSSGNENNLGQHKTETGIGTKSNTNGLSHHSNWHNSLRLPQIPIGNGDTNGGYLSDSNIGDPRRVRI